MQILYQSIVRKSFGTLRSVPNAVARSNIRKRPLPEIGKLLRVTSKTLILARKFVMPPRLHLHLLGGFRATLDDTPLTRFESAKVRALLAYLAVEADHPHSRDELSTLLWSERDSKAARNNLRRSLSNLQTLLGNATQDPPFLLITRADVQFNLASDVAVDVAEFSRMANSQSPAAISHLRSAISHYRGDLLEHFFLNDSPAFEEWLTVAREQLRQRVMHALAIVTAHFEAQGAAGHEHALEYARRQIELEPWHEEPHRVVMRTLAALGQSDAALAQYQTLRDTLHQELSVEPSAETTAFYNYLIEARGTLSPSAVAKVESSAASVPTNLPAPPSPLVGRERELQILGERLTHHETRLLTLTGMGGMGKTRLALEVARAHVSKFPRGVFFVDLAPVLQTELMPNAIAQAMAFHFQGAQPPTAQIIQHLQTLDDDLLLLLDNLEHLLSAVEGNGAELFADILKHASHVKLLATSRERLNLASEWVFEVDGLSAPAQNVAPSIAWDETEAVQLFSQCAARAQISSAAWDDENRRAVIHIAQLVEGMPLALELAAAWVRTLSPAEIAREIDHGLDVLTTTRRDLPKRHASIRAVFEHSWQLLKENERAVFARLSVFRGGFTRDGAREIAGASLQTLSALVEKSLLKRAASGRYRLHEFVRQFAAEKLAEGGEQENTQKNFGAYFLGMVNARGERLNRAGAADALEALRAEIENVRAAWTFACAQHDWGALSETLNPLTDFFHASNLFQQGVDVLEQAVAAQPNAALESRAVTQQARLLNLLALYEPAIVRSQRALALNADAESVAGGYLYWGQAARRQGDAETARKLLAQAIARAQTARAPEVEWRARMFLGGTFWNATEFEEARIHWLAALQICRALVNQRGEGLLLNNLGLLAQDEGAYERAQNYFQDAMHTSSIVGDYWLWGIVSSNLGLLEIDRFLYDAAQTHLHQALHHFLQLKNEWVENISRLGLGTLAARLGDFARAERELKHAHQALHTLQARSDELRCLTVLALLAHQQNENQRALEFGAQAIPLARELQDRVNWGRALLVCGHARVALNDLAHAENDYAAALTLFEALRLKSLQAEARAGIARVALARGDLESARVNVEWILDFLKTQTLEGTEEPVRVYLTCDQVLRALGDLRAAEVLERARAWLQMIAAGITDEHAREMFFKNIPAHHLLFSDMTDSPRPVV